MLIFHFHLVVNQFATSFGSAWLLFTIFCLLSTQPYFCRFCTNIPCSFVSRANPKNNNDHIILGVLGYKPREFAAQMNLNLANGWGIVRTIMDMCLKMPEGKYVLLKDPNKQVVRLYQVPDNTFEEDADEREAPVPEAENEE